MNRNGGRDKDRTCDPYDVNTVRLPETRHHLSSLKRHFKLLLASSALFLGHSLGEFERAAQWLAANWDEVRGPVWPVLRRRFKLNADQLMAAVAWACALTSAGFEEVYDHG
ncbi:hypothetical protein MUU53_04540 [Rhizobium lemnae]|uniref:Transposase n=1 Tax=Rhizobium lemnae TaxID=1214924 RepID=A0ABV8E3K9_9HYPH|nr:hypothetical protein [Rhizobium lemnae]MCJ8507176.1 hypothetical protein [Rhizobium lemnae]